MPYDKTIARLLRDSTTDAHASILEFVPGAGSYAPSAKSAVFTSNTYYERVATVDGVNAATGATVVLAVGPLGGAGGVTNIDTALVSLSIYNTTIDSQVRLLGVPTPAAPAWSFSVKSTGTYTAELWLARPAFHKAVTATVLTSWGTSAVKMDSGTTTAPASLAASTVVAAVGTTAQRPSLRVAGQPYFDTTLNKPVWWNGSVWVDATGTTA